MNPERWYIAFWLLMGLSFLALQYLVVVRPLVTRLDALLDVLRHGLR